MGKSWVDMQMRKSMGKSWEGCRKYIEIWKCSSYSPVNCELSMVIFNSDFNITRGYCNSARSTENPHSSHPKYHGEVDLL